MAEPPRKRARPAAPALPRKEPKFYSPDASAAQAASVASARAALEAVLAHSAQPRGHPVSSSSSRSSAAAARWVPAERRALVTRERGRALESVGTRGPGGALWLDPEEALWLAERGAVRLVTCDDVDGQGVTAAGAYALYAASGRPLRSYAAYAHLRRLGYVVRAAEPLEVEYDVYRPGRAGWRSAASVPDFALCVARYEDAAPAAERIAATAARCWPVPLRLAVVSDAGSVTFYAAEQQ
eukprot:m51a1_g5012 putative sen54p (240) ;mRNA; r:262621-263526